MSFQSEANQSPNQNLKSKHQNSAKALRGPDSWKNGHVTSPHPRGWSCVLNTTQGTKALDISFFSSDLWSLHQCNQLSHQWLVNIISYDAMVWIKLICKYDSLLYGIMCHPLVQNSLGIHDCLSQMEWFLDVSWMWQGKIGYSKLSWGSLRVRMLQQVNSGNRHHWDQWANYGFAMLRPSPMTHAQPSLNTGRAVLNLKWLIRPGCQAC